MGKRANGTDGEVFADPVQFDRHGLFVVKHICAGDIVEPDCLKESDDRRRDRG